MCESAQHTIIQDLLCAPGMGQVRLEVENWFKALLGQLWWEAALGTWAGGSKTAGAVRAEVAARVKATL